MIIVIVYLNDNERQLNSSPKILYFLLLLLVTNIYRDFFILITLHLFLE